MTDDAGFVFQFRVGLPTPASGSPFLFFANFDVLFNPKSEKRLNAVKPCRLKNVLDFDNFIRLFRIKIQLSNRYFGTEIAAANRTRLHVFRGSDRVSTTAADVSVFPRSITVMRLFHGRVIVMGQKVEKKPYSTVQRQKRGLFFVNFVPPLCPLWLKYFNHKGHKDFTKDTREKCRGFDVQQYLLTISDFHDP